MRADFLQQQHRSFAHSHEGVVVTYPISKLHKTTSYTRDVVVRSLGELKNMFVHTHNLQLMKSLTL